MTKALEQYSKTRAGKRVFKVIIALTLMPTIILRAILLDVFTDRTNSFSICE